MLFFNRLLKIKVKEYQRGNQKRTIKRNW